MDLLFDKYKYMYGHLNKTSTPEILQFDINSFFNGLFQLPFPPENIGIVNPEMVTGKKLNKRVRLIQLANLKQLV